MNTAKKTDRIIIVVLLILAVCIVAGLIFGGKSGPYSNTNTSSGQVTYQDYNGKKIGILTGTNMEKESFRFFPDSEYLYYDGYPNMNAALESGVIDAYLGDEPALKSIHAEQPQISYIKERLTNNKYSFAFRKNDPEYNPIESGDELSLMIVTRLAKDVQYSRDDRNHMEIRI